MFPVSLLALSHSAQPCFSLLLVSEVAQSPLAAFLFFRLSTALLLIVWYSLLPIFCKAKQNVSVGFPPFLSDHVQWLLFQWKLVCGTKFWGKNSTPPFLPPVRVNIPS